jgi:hypothetical protein
MIEKTIDGVPHWWIRKPDQYGYWDDSDRWTTDPNKARHYSEQWEAIHVIGSDMVGCVATEHVFMDQGSQVQESAE